MQAKQSTVTGRGLGAELKAFREERKLSTRKAADLLGWPQSKISKIETGKQGITPADVASLLAVYGVRGHEREVLIAKAEKSDEPGLWEVQGGLPRESRTLIQLEPQAIRVFDMEPLWVPGLLQTGDYTRAVMEACRVPAEDVEIRVAARLGRQAILSRADPPQLEFVVDESVLRRGVLPRKLLARQLRHMAEAAERPNVTLRVLPLALGAHTGLDGPFAVLEFTKEKTIVHLEHKISGLFLEAEHEVAFYLKEVDTLREIALSPSESVDLVVAIAKDIENG